MSHSKKENVLLADVYSVNSLQEAEKEIRQGMLTRLFVLATKEHYCLVKICHTFLVVRFDWIF